MITTIAGIAAVVSIWVPWLRHPLEVYIEREGLALPGTPKFAEYQKMLEGIQEPADIFNYPEGGTNGKIQLGFPLPAWFLITFVPIAAVTSILSILKLFETSLWIVVALIGTSSAILLYWVGTAVASGSAIEAGFPIFALSASVIFIAALKTNRSENETVGIPRLSP